jgi:OmpA-OmpF porin, OOP family
MNRALIIIFLIVICSDLNSQQRKLITTYYRNGQIESKGYLYTYSLYYNIKKVAKLTKFGVLEKKGGEWRYWYQNGEPRRTENYKFIRDKDPNDLPDGKWIYFNEEGKKYREETWNNGVLINYYREIFNDSGPAGKITLQNGITDTTLLTSLTKGDNLIINPDFDYYYYKTVPIIYDGRSRIDEWIPFWVTPGNYTPDYLSNLRTIDVLSNYYLFDFELPKKFSFAGLGLYRKNETYSEYIRGKLAQPLLKSHRYCIRITLAMPSYSGYEVNRIAFHLSSSPVSIDDSNESTLLPQVILSITGVDNKRFTTLCDYFTAEGGERYISIGRFTSADKLEINARENIPMSQFGIEQSAYYLIDNVDLHEIQDTTECYCKTVKIQSDSIHLVTDPDIGNIQADLNKLNPGESIILKNVNFSFDSYSLLPGSESILTVLLNYLRNNRDISILISGHTDDIGSEQYNQELSENRAKSIYIWLVKNGVDSQRLKYKGFGKNQPLNNNEAEESRALNRRVEVKRIETVQSQLK